MFLLFSSFQSTVFSRSKVMEAFRRTLSTFCEEQLGMPLDPTGIVELESSTPQKFSKHVIVKRLGNGSQSRPLAFANNAQAGLIVNHLVRYADSRKDSDKASESLFLQSPSRDGHVVSVIDESVYSRNRSFRLLFQSKYGKTRRLDLDPASWFCLVYILYFYLFS